MDIPKVKFTHIPLSKEVDWIHGFLYQNEWGWGRYIIRKHPKIKNVFSYKTEKEQIKFLRDHITNFKKDNQRIIEKNKIQYQKEWRKIEKETFTTLSDIMEIGWPKNRRMIKAMISINPICPRFLDEWSFSIFYNYKRISHAMEVIMHESSHFLYFEKWKKLYPKVSNRKFESPHIEWHLSEIVTPIILNDERIKKILKQKAFFYEEHEKLIINNKSVPEYFTELYNKNNNFEQFLDESYKIIKEKQDLFNCK